MDAQFLPLVLLDRLLSTNRKLLNRKDLSWMLLEDLPARPWDILAVGVLIMLPLSVVAEANFGSFVVVRRTHVLLLLPQSLWRRKSALVPAMGTHILLSDLGFLMGGEWLHGDRRMRGKVRLVGWMWNEGPFSGEEKCFFVGVEHGQ